MIRDHDLLSAWSFEHKRTHSHKHTTRSERVEFRFGVRTLSDFRRLTSTKSAGNMVCASAVAFLRAISSFLVTNRSFCSIAENFLPMSVTIEVSCSGYS